jgi:hypothetical protein
VTEKGLCAHGVPEHLCLTGREGRSTLPFVFGDRRHWNAVIAVGGIAKPIVMEFASEKRSPQLAAGFLAGTRPPGSCPYSFAKSIRRVRCSGSRRWS